MEAAFGPGALENPNRKALVQECPLTGGEEGARASLREALSPRGGAGLGASVLLGLLQSRRPRVAARDAARRAGQVRGTSRAERRLARREALEHPGGVERAARVRPPVDEDVVPAANVHRQPGLDRIPAVVRSIRSLTSSKRQRSAIRASGRRKLAVVPRSRRPARASAFERGRRLSVRRSISRRRCMYGSGPPSEAT